MQEIHLKSFEMQAFVKELFVSFTLAMSLSSACSGMNQTAQAWTNNLYLNTYISLPLCKHSKSDWKFNFTSSFRKRN